MADAWTPDFGGVSAFTPIWPNGEYEIEVRDVRFSAWEKERDDGGTSIVKRVRLLCKLNGVYDSAGELVEELPDGRNVAGEDVTPFDLYLHSDGAMRMAKRTMMAVLGYAERDEADFNEWAAEADLAFEAVEQDDGSYEVKAGDSWSDLKGRLFIASLEPEIDDYNDEEREVQNVRSTRPVG